MDREEEREREEEKDEERLSGVLHITTTQQDICEGKRKEKERENEEEDEEDRSFVKERESVNEV